MSRQVRSEATRRKIFDAAIEVFGTHRTYLTPDWYSFKLCAAEPGEIRTQLGLVLDTPYGVDDLVCADLVVVPAAGTETTTNTRWEPFGGIWAVFVIWMSTFGV